MCSHAVPFLLSKWHHQITSTSCANLNMCLTVFSIFFLLSNPLEVLVLYIEVKDFHNTSLVLKIILCAIFSTTISPLNLVPSSLKYTLSLSSKPQKYVFFFFLLGDEFFREQLSFLISFSFGLSSQFRVYIRFVFYFPLYFFLQRQQKNQITVQLTKSN